jgi:hypothetical protein
MASNLIISLADLQQYRPVGDLDNKRVDPYILEAQENDLRPILNDALYKDFVEKYSQATTPNYSELLNGKSWTYCGQTVQFNGVKPMLCYYTLARIIANNQINIVPYGVVQKVVQQSQPVDAGTLKMQISELRSVAIRYQNDLILFLENNISSYPLYNKLATVNQNKTGLKFFSA